ncbi:hypothetical protein [Streptomyces puniciscabiei]|uniref:hypothetical protein n=1 Tax=Streptomyces puniciscabiei TaxID=164348 RepID=UPI0006EB37FB|nr:hypothetical protein [Streptomyces puniciscabiei]
MHRPLHRPKPRITVIGGGFAGLTAHLRTGTPEALTIPAGIVHGCTIAIWWAAGVMLLAGLTAGLMVTARAPKHEGAAEAPVPESVT